MSGFHLVYVAGPYTQGDPVINTRTATRVGLDIYEKTGAGVIIPHLSLLAHAMFPADLDFWYEYDLAQLRHCTALYRMPGASSGADAEVAFAHRNAIPVFDNRGTLNRFLAQ